MTWRDVLATALVAGAVVACESTCEEAQEKLSACADEIRRTLAEQPDHSSAFSLGFSDECTEFDKCVAECVNAADCSAIAHTLVHGGQDDPNDRPPGSLAFNQCVVDCAPDRPPSAEGSSQ